MGIVLSLATAGHILQVTNNVVNDVFLPIKVQVKNYKINCSVLQLISRKINVKNINVHKLNVKTLSLKTHLNTKKTQINISKV